MRCQDHAFARRWRCSFVQCVEASCQSGREFWALRPAKGFDTIFVPTIRGGLWILWDKEAAKESKYYGLVVTEIIQRPLQRCLNMRIMTGRHREKWQHLIKHIEDFAWLNNCDSLELIARPGWKKVLKPFGYTETHVLLQKKKEK